MWSSCQIDFRSLPAKALAWTIQPKAWGMNRPSTALHSSLVATPSGPKTGPPAPDLDPPFHRAASRNAPVHMTVPARDAERNPVVELVFGGAPRCGIHRTNQMELAGRVLLI